MSDNNKPLYGRIRKFGYEIEYPVNRDMLLSCLMAEVMPTEYRKYEIHSDCGGIEWTTPHPFDTMDEVRDFVHMVYDFHDGDWQEILWQTAMNREPHKAKYYDTACFIDFDKLADIMNPKTNYFNGNSVGVHIRIDVTHWHTIEKLRFMRLFGTGMESKHDYVEWLEGVLGRGIYNWNKPTPYAHARYCILNNETVDTKMYNAQYEFNMFPSVDDPGDDVETIELRAYGVNQDKVDALKQLDSIETLCRITERSLQYGVDGNVVDKLYNAWRDVVLGENNLPHNPDAVPSVNEGEDPVLNAYSHSFNNRRNRDYDGTYDSSDVCPVCGSYNTNITDTDFNLWEGWHQEEYACNECNASWTAHHNVEIDYDSHHDVYTDEVDWAAVEDYNEEDPHND